MPKDKKPSHVPAGEYNVTVTKAESQVSENGDEMVILTLTVRGGRHTFFDHLVFNEASCWRIAYFLTAIGIELQNGDDIHPHLFVGRTARALVAVVYDGGYENKIAKWLPPAHPTVKGGPQ